MGAFGKDDSNLKNKPGFRSNPTDLRQQNSLQDDSRAKGGGGGARRVPTFVNKFEPDKLKFDKIRICKSPHEVELAETSSPGETYLTTLDYFPYTSHFNARVKLDATCSAGPWAGTKKFAKPCRGCEEFFAGMVIDPKTNKKKAGHVSKRDMNALSVFDYAKFHKVDQTDKTGKVKTNPETGESYKTWAKCKGRGCAGCAENAETMDGMMRHWSLGSSHWNTLLDRNDELKKSCASCGTKDSIQVTGYFCQNKECGEPVILMEDTSYTDAEIAKLVKSPMKCGGCGAKDYVVMQYECTNCGDPRAATIFDCDMQVKRVEAADGGQQTTLQFGDITIRGMSAQFLDRFKPLELHEIFKPADEEWQTHVFGASDEEPTKGAGEYQKKRL